MPPENTFTRDYIEAGFKLSERDRLRDRFVMGRGLPPDLFGHLPGADKFLAEILADPEKAASCAAFFPKILGLNGEAAPFTPRILPWSGGEICGPAFAADFPPDDGLTPDDRQMLMDYQGRIAALMLGAAISGVTPLFEPFIYRQSWDGRAIEIPRRADRVLILGFVRAPKIMGMNPQLSKLRPGIGWLDWEGQVAAVLKMAEFIASMGYAALPSAGGIVMADHLGALAGLGEVGRQGLLITPEYGPNLRLFTIITDYPFTLDRPNIFGVADYCETCQRCINECPAKAISEGHRRPGLYKWPLNRRACFDNWLEKRDPCMKCIEICPYTREPLAGSAGPGCKAQKEIP